MKWDTVKVEDVVEIIDGDRGKNYPKQHEFQDSGWCLFLNTGNVTNEGFMFENNQFITIEKDLALRKGKLQRGDIVYTTRGTIGNAGYYDGLIPYDNLRINSGMVVLRARSEIAYAKFVYQLLKSSYQKDRIKAYITGSAQPQLPIKNLSKIPISLPPYDIQRQIADFIFSYDDLINNNQKQIKLLEEAAMRLYNEWFVMLRFPGHETTETVDGVPKGWQIKVLKEVCSLIRRGISPKYNEHGESTVINQKCIRNMQVNMSYARKQEKIFSSELQLKDGDVVICSTGEGTLGRVGQISGDYPKTTFDSHVTLVRASDSVGVNYLGRFLQSNEAYFVNIGRGSTNQTELSRSAVETLKIIIPSANIMNEYEKLAQQYRIKIMICNQTINHLRQARDKLLPKLMSGEIEL